MKKYHQILCAIDFSKSTDKVIESALNFFNHGGENLTIVHFVDPLPASGLTAEMAEIEGQLMEVARQKMQALVEKYDLTNADIKIIDAYAKSEITKFAKEIKADLIVLGRHGHHGFLHGLMGSKASAVLNHAACDVLVVR